MATAAAPGREAEEAAVYYGEGSRLTAAASPTALTVTV